MPVDLTWKYDIRDFVTLSRKNGNVFVGQSYSQLIADPTTGFETLTLNKDNRNGGNIDFCHQEESRRFILLRELHASNQLCIW
jgi:hypothetical protein